MPVFVSDTFTEAASTALASHTPEVGGAWSQHPTYTGGATVGAGTGTVAGNSAATTSLHLNSATAPDDCVVEATFQITSLSTTRIGVALRFDPSADTGYYVFYNGSSWTMDRLVNGNRWSGSAIGFSSMVLPLNVPYRLRLVAVGRQVNAFLNNSWLFGFYDTSPTPILSGRVGVMVRSGDLVTDFSADDANAYVGHDDALFRVQTIGRHNAVALPAVAWRRAPPVVGNKTRQAQFVGRGIISGTVAEKGTPNTPVRRRVRLYQDRDGLFVREVWSDPVTGAYSFEYVDEAMTYTVLSYDHTLNFRAVVADRIAPEIML